MRKTSVNFLWNWCVLCILSWLCSFCVLSPLYVKWNLTQFVCLSYEQPCIPDTIVLFHSAKLIYALFQTWICLIKAGVDIPPWFPIVFTTPYLWILIPFPIFLKETQNSDQILCGWCFMKLNKAEIGLKNCNAGWPLHLNT